jgi:hypothetical protein
MHNPSVIIIEMPSTLQQRYFSSRAPRFTTIRSKKGIICFFVYKADNHMVCPLQFGIAF